MSKVKEITLDDLKDDLMFIPLSVAKEMIEEQKRQGNKADITVFQNCKCATKFDGGFDWPESIKGGTYWNNMLS